MSDPSPSNSEFLASTLNPEEIERRIKVGEDEVRKLKRLLRIVKEAERKDAEPARHITENNAG